MTRNEILAEIEALKQKAEALKAKTIADALEEINIILASDGITLADLGLQAIKTNSTKVPAPVKFRQGDRSWSGRGKRPAWVATHLSSGGTLEQIAA